MRSLETRLAKLEQVAPEEPRVIQLICEPQRRGEPPLTPEEEAVLEAEQARKLAEAREHGQSLVLVMWDRQEARRLGAPPPEPPSEGRGFRLIIIDPETGQEFRPDTLEARLAALKATPGGKVNG